MHFKLVAFVVAKLEVAMEVVVAEEAAVTEVTKMIMLKKRPGMLCLMRRAWSLLKLEAFAQIKEKINRIKKEIHRYKWLDNKFKKLEHRIVVKMT